MVCDVWFVIVVIKTNKMKDDAEKTQQFGPFFKVCLVFPLTNAVV